MVTRDQLIKFIDSTLGHDLLAKANKIDHRANGVQIHGKNDINKIALGVSCSLEFLEEAVGAGADCCIFHHGVDLDSSSIYNSRLNLSQQKILRYIFEHNLTVGGYHFSLDANPSIGNSATIINLLGAKRLDMPYMSEWGWVAEFEQPQTVESVAEKCSDIFSHDIFAVYGGPKMIKRFGVATGGAKPTGEYIHELAAKGIELHITGEIGEGGPAMARECGYNYFSCGHYATEVFGVQELGKKIKAHFQNKLEVEFIDIPNPL